MDKVGLGVVTNPPLGNAKGNIPDASCGNPWQPDVDRLPAHVKTVRRNFAAFRGKHGVGRRRPIAGYDANRLIELDVVSYLMKNVEKRWINGFDTAGSEIPQVVADLRKSLRQIGAIAPVDRCQRFECMKVVETKLTRCHGGVAKRSRRL